MANDSPHIPDSRGVGAPAPEPNGSESPNYWASPPRGPHESELFEAPSAEKAAAPHPIPWGPVAADEPAVVEAVIDHTSEARVVREYEAGEFREVARPARGGLFAGYTPPATDPLAPAAADRKKRRHGLRSRR
jgi:hypothetical protein